MRWIVCLTWLVLGFAAAARAEARATLYESPFSKLTYQYASESKGSKGEAWTYALDTEMGPLALTVRSDAERYVVVTELKGEPSKEIVTLLNSPDPDSGEIEVAWPGLRQQANYAKRGGASGVEPVGGVPMDCEFLLHGRLGRTKQLLLDRWGAELARHAAPPRHLEELVAALHAARHLPLLAEGCDASQSPAGGACYYDTSNYGDCEDCCDSYQGIAKSLCTGAVARFCRSAWCLELGERACENALDFGSNFCDLHNCRGKPGDPSCNPNHVCEGRCINFCGPGWSSGCGHCDGQDANHQACCR